MTTLTQLAEELETAVPPVGGVPASAQYAQAVRDAVADFGRRVPRVLRGTFTTVSGTAAYNLPSGFQRLIALEALTEVFRDTTGHLVAGFSPGDETYTVAGGQLTLYPTPAYAAERVIRYSAGYPYDDGTDTFTGLTEDLEPVMLLKARAGALRTLAQASAGSAGLNYRIGDVSVQRTLTQGHAAVAADLETEYADACRALVGRIGLVTDLRRWGWPV